VTPSTTTWPDVPTRRRRTPQETKSAGALSERLKIHIFCEKNCHDLKTGLVQRVGPRKSVVKSLPRLGDPLRLASGRLLDFVFLVDVVQPIRCTANSDGLTAQALLYPRSADDRF
jgi:hypothetical protein